MQGGKNDLFILSLGGSKSRDAFIDITVHVCYDIIFIITIIIITFIIIKRSQFNRFIEHGGIFFCT